jgi:hypothetical protein
MGTRLPGDAAPHDGDALGFEAPGLFGLVARRQPAAGHHDPPPRQAVARRQHRADAASRARIAGLGGDVAVAHDLTRLQAVDHVDDPSAKVGRHPPDDTGPGDGGTAGGRPIFP